MESLKCKKECKYVGCKYNKSYDKKSNTYNFLPKEKEDVSLCNCYLEIEEKPLFTYKKRK